MLFFAVDVAPRQQATDARWVGYWDFSLSH
jgi:hypothetical protein